MCKKDIPDHAREGSPVTLSHTSPVKLARDDARLWRVGEAVVDLAPWAASHPGGELVINQCRGLDVTHLLHSYHTNLEPIYRVLDRHLVRGQVDRAALARPEWAKAPRAKRDAKAPWFILAWNLAWALTALGALPLYAFGLASWRLCVLMGLGIWWGCGDVLHSGSHFALFRRPLWNVRWASFFGLLHHVPGAWVRQHNLSHHIYTNDDLDVDVHHFSHGLGALGIGWRVSPASRPREHHSLATLPFAMCITGIGPLIVETLTLLKTSRYYRMKFVLSPAERRVAALQVAFVLAVFVSAISRTPLKALVPWAVHGTMYYVFSQVSHVSTDTEHEFDAPNASEWCEHQLKAAPGDWGTRSRFAALISNGLNNQGMHHLHPSIHWWHYPAEEAKIAYPAAFVKERATRETRTLYDTWCAHIAHLRSLNGPYGAAAVEEKKLR